MDSLFYFSKKKKKKKKDSLFSSHSGLKENNYKLVWN